MPLLDGRNDAHGDYLVAELAKMLVALDKCGVLLGRALHVLVLDALKPCVALLATSRP